MPLPARSRKRLPQVSGEWAGNDIHHYSLFGGLMRMAGRASLLINPKLLGLMTPFLPLRVSLEGGAG